MTATQKFRRVLFSRYGALSLISLIFMPYLLSLLPEVRTGDKVLGWIAIGIFLVPIVAFISGLAHFEGQDYKMRLEERPEEERGEGLIAFLFEDEDEGKR